MADIIELILADHLQIMGWAARLGDLSRRDRGRDDRAELAATRETLAALIDLHMRADDEICGPAVFGGDPDGRAMTRQTRDEVREIIRETSLQPPGTLRWWHLARTALSAWPIPASARWPVPAGPAAGRWSGLCSGSASTCESDRSRPGRVGSREPVPSSPAG
ncbi:MAG TPA: hypothetical protein VFV73_23940 [Streptosporangiaceae bacterium]|nr:hypothetical protein [Streptosporangiaceae bacterium]